MASSLLINLTAADAITGTELVYLSQGGADRKVAVSALLTNPTVGTQAPGNNTTLAASTAFVTAAVAAAGGGTVSSVNITQPAAGITASGGPITTSGAITLALADDLAAVEGLATTGIVRRTALNTWSAGTAVSLTTEVTGLLPIANGGTGNTNGSAAYLTSARTIGGTSFDGQANITQPFDVHAYYPGVPTASAKVLRVPIARAITFAANLAGSYGIASVAATASTAFDVAKNGTSVGTITFAAAATTATFVTAGGTSFSLVAGDRISITAPASPDATLADPAFVLAGTR